MEELQLASREQVPLNFTGIIHFLDGITCWYVGGKFHREDGPAREWLHGRKEWYKHGFLHNEEGPAILSGFTNPPEYWLDGYRIYPQNKYCFIDGEFIGYSLFDDSAQILCEKYRNYQWFCGITLVRHSFTQHYALQIICVNKPVDVIINPVFREIDVVVSNFTD